MPRFVMALESKLLIVAVVAVEPVVMVVAAVDAPVVQVGCWCCLLLTRSFQSVTVERVC
jgi:hypothetical protein